MASTCIGDCINDTRVRPTTYATLHKWPESEAEFVRTVSGRSNGSHEARQPRVVDSISCRQMYLRSYTFSRKETVPEKTMKCLGKVKDRVKSSATKRNKTNPKTRNHEAVVKRKNHCNLLQRTVKKTIRDSLASMFSRLLSCTTKVDVADHGGL